MLNISFADNSRFCLRSRHVISAREPSLSDQRVRRAEKFTAALQRNSDNFYLNDVIERQILRHLGIWECTFFLARYAPQGCYYDRWNMKKIVSAFINLWICWSKWNSKKKYFKYYFQSYRFYTVSNWNNMLNRKRGFSR